MTCFRRLFFDLNFDFIPFFSILSFFVELGAISVLFYIGIHYHKSSGHCGRCPGQRDVRRGICLRPIRFSTRCAAVVVVWVGCLPFGMPDSAVQELRGPMLRPTWAWAMSVYGCVRRLPTQRAEWLADLGFARPPASQTGSRMTKLGPLRHKSACPQPSRRTRAFAETLPFVEPPSRFPSGKCTLRRTAGLRLSNPSGFVFSCVGLRRTSRPSSNLRPPPRPSSNFGIVLACD